MQEVSPGHGHLEWETPLYRTALAQYELALPYADVEEFVAERLRYPERSLVVSVPVKLDSGRWTVFPGYRVQHSTRARAHEGRRPVRPRGDARRMRGACDVDDLEVRAAAAPVRRGQGRRPLQPARPLARRAPEDHTQVHLRAAPDHRPAGGHPGAGHGHERADDGLDDGHLLDAGRPRRPGDRHGQADLARRVALPARGHRRGGGDGDRARVRAARVEARRAALRRPGVRERGRDRGGRARGRTGRRWSRCPTSRAAFTTRPGSTSTCCGATRRSTARSRATTRPSA